MEHVFCLRVWLSGSDPTAGLHFPGIFADADAAVAGFRERIEDHVKGLNHELGDFVCEVFNSERKLVRMFRAQKFKGAVVIHQPNCRCQECFHLFRMEALLDS